MTRLVTLSLCVTLAGCVNTPHRKVTLPPLPEHPGNPPRNSEPVPVTPLSAQWEINAACRDILEYRASIAHDWEEIPGPYDALDVDGILCYTVPVAVGHTAAFFRIRRDWGNPWVATPKIEMETNARK